MILVIIRMKIYPAKRLELSQTITSLVDSMITEPGCRRLNFCQNVENENELYLLEEWENQEMLKNHLISELFKVLRGAMNMLLEAWEMEFFTLFHPSGIEKMLQMIKPGEITESSIDATIPRMAVKEKALGKIEVNLVYIPTLLKREKFSIP